MNKASERAWTAIQEEQRRDRMLRKISKIAWTVVGVIVLAFALVYSIAVAQMVKSAMMGALPWMTLTGVTFPLVIVLGTVSLFIATLSTIGIFVRMRTSSMNEIQLRLAALEELLSKSEER
jgi:uncharacterized membrane protein